MFGYPVRASQAGALGGHCRPEPWEGIADRSPGRALQANTQAPVLYSMSTYAHTHTHPWPCSQPMREQKLNTPTQCMACTRPMHGTHPVLCCSALLRPDRPPASLTRASLLCHHKHSESNSHHPRRVPAPAAQRFSAIIHAEIATIQHPHTCTHTRERTHAHASALVPTLAT